MINYLPKLYFLKAAQTYFSQSLLIILQQYNNNNDTLNSLEWLSESMKSYFSFMDIQRRCLLLSLRIAAADELRQEWSPQALAYPPKNFPFLL